MGWTNVYGKVTGTYLLMRRSQSNSAILKRITQPFPGTCENQEWRTKKQTRPGTFAEIETALLDTQA